MVSVWTREAVQLVVAQLPGRNARRGLLRYSDAPLSPCASNPSPPGGAGGMMRFDRDIAVVQGLLTATGSTGRKSRGPERPTHQNKNKRFTKGGAMKLHHAIAMLLLIGGGLPALAADPRVAQERADTSEVVQPLREALGAEAYEAAMASGRYTYVGNTKCRMCHKAFVEGRKNDVHDHAYSTLVEARDATSPRCLACHSTGAGVPSGFTSIQETPRLMHVQCEGCHGPASEHMRRFSKGGFLAGPDRPEILKKMCLACHNGRWNRAFTDFDSAFLSYKQAKPAAAGAEPVAGSPKTN